MYDTGHEECDVSLDVCWEIIHQFDKLGSEVTLMPQKTWRSRNAEH